MHELDDYFLPSVKFVVEEIADSVMSSGYRNRVSYGAKVGVRVGPDHLLALNVPTGGFLTEPAPEDLMGFEESDSDSPRSQRDFRSDQNNAILNAG
ncbi:hypothetical protein GBA65_17260 [Rubrobacter marinus]|uniref:Uncharacterized protein n=1 Tax=Rubrobacter marinus TaxID=2653852 RepID=A0A6G8Q0M0_9ACTN|nr:hypothetical protein [Rubrobacter marinus]QIN79978.1 hypothetical protein GBA65_17260 [Rubrobacter marinus]